MPKTWPRSLERSAARRTRKDLRTRHGEEIAMMPNGYDCFPHVLSTHGRRYLPSLCHAKYYVAPPLHDGRLSRYCLSPLDQVIRRNLRHAIISILVETMFIPLFLAIGHCMPVRCTPMRCTPMRHTHETHAREVHAREMHACEVHAYEMHAHEMHAHEVHAYETHAHEIYAREMHAHEVHAYEMHAC